MDSEPHPSATTTIPSDSTAPAPAPSPPSKPSNRRSPPPKSSILFKLRAYLLRHIVRLALKTDRTLVRLSKLLANPASTDALLCTLSYTLELLHALLSRLLERRLTKFATSIAEKADDVLLPGETLIATLPAPSSAQYLAQVAGSAKALAAIMGDFRIFVRLWGLAGIYMWARSTFHAPLPTSAGRKEKLLRGITWGQITSCVLFQVLENGAYLAGKGALTSTSWSGDAGKVKEIKWWIWSSRFWAAHVILELVRLAVLQYYHTPPSPSSSASSILTQSSVSAEEKQKIDDNEKEGKLLLEEKKRENWLWWRDLVSNVAYMPMTLHWSVEEERGILSDWGVGLLGATAGGALLVDAWRATG